MEAIALPRSAHAQPRGNKVDTERVNPCSSEDCSCIPTHLSSPLRANRVDCVTFLEAVTLRVALEETECREDESPAAPLLDFPSSGDSASSEKTN